MQQEEQQQAAEDHCRLTVALKRAARGWYVLPCDGKRPLTTHGLNASTTDADTIRQWAKQWPDANYAVDCARSQWVVADIDPRNGGDLYSPALADAPDTLRS